MVALDVLLADAGDHPAQDAALAVALRATPNLVLSSELVDNDHSWEDPLPQFRGDAALGHVHAQPDQDGITRSILLEQRVAPGASVTDPRDLHRWAFALEAFRVSRRARIVENSVLAGGLAEKSLQVGGTVIPVQLRRDKVGGDPKRLMRVRYFPPGMTLPRVSIKRLIDDPALASRLTGKAVFIGLTAQNVDIRDRLFTPFSNTPGIEINAAAYETIARGSFITDLGFQWVIPISLALMAAIGLSFRYLPGWWAYLAGAGILLLAMADPLRLFYLPARLSVCDLGVGGMARHRHRGVVLPPGGAPQSRIEQTSRERYQQAMHFVTHEMRTPLSAIQGSSELISRYPLTEDKRKQIAQLINSESKRLARMIEIFLNVERLSAGQMELKREPISVSDDDRDLPGARAPGGRAQAYRDRAGPDSRRTYRDGRPRVDGVRLLQSTYECGEVFAPRNRSYRLRQKNDSQVRIAVQDQGIGMDQKEVKQIFQKFYRTKKAEESGEAGTGIGLSIVEQIVEQHGGRIEVASQPGQGSCFTMVLPAPAGDPCRHRRGTTLMQKLLLVEDDPRFSSPSRPLSKPQATPSMPSPPRAKPSSASAARPIRSSSPISISTSAPASTCCTPQRQIPSAPSS